MARSLHFDGGRQSCETDMESLFYSLLDVVSNGQALRWRHLFDPALVRVSKYATVHDDMEWERSIKHCMEPLIPMLESVRKVVRQQNPSLSMYLRAFGVRDDDV